MLEHFLSASNIAVYGLLLLVILSCRHQLETNGKLLFAAGVAFAGYFSSLYLSATPLLSQFLISSALALLLSSTALKLWTGSNTKFVAICGFLIAIGTALPASWLPFFEALILLATGAVLLRIEPSRSLYNWATSHNTWANGPNKL